MTDYTNVKRPAHYQNTIASFFEVGESFEYFPKVYYLTFLLSGSIRITIGDEKTEEFHSPTMFLVPKEKTYKRVVLAPSQIITFPLDGEKLRLSLLALTKEQCKEKSERNTIPSLPINSQFHKLLLLFSESFSFSYLNETYYDLKLTELMYLIKTQLTDEERGSFFSCIIDDEFLFVDFIMDNYKRTDSVKELARLSCYSLSGFEKRFKRVFNITPSVWLKERKKRSICEELYYTNKSLKQISSEYGFSSPTHFNKYCKSIFGMSPGEIRKKKLTMQSL